MNQHRDLNGSEISSIVHSDPPFTEINVGGSLELDTFGSSRKKVEVNTLVFSYIHSCKKNYVLPFNLKRLIGIFFYLAMYSFYFMEKD